MNVLFICSRNRRRSPTAEEVFRDWPGVETASAGLSDDAECVLDSDMVTWADVILVMESVHLSRLKKRFGPLLKGRKTASLGIPDDFEPHDPELVALLKKKVPPFLKLSSGAARSLAKHDHHD